MNLKMNILAVICFFGITITGCNDSDVKYGYNNDYEIEDNGNGSSEGTISYETLFDPIHDAGQYTFPEMKRKPARYWSCIDALVGSNRNAPDLDSKGVQYHLLCQSIAGLVNRAVDEGKSDIGIWLRDEEHRDSYAVALNGVQAMNVTEQGLQTGTELAVNTYSDEDGFKRNVRHLFEGYVLTDVRNNPESSIVASVAAHVHNSIIVDVRDEQTFKNAGYEMKYDARNKTTRNAWEEFKDKCNNEGLVLMPVNTGELRDFAIQHGYFVINLNSSYAVPDGANKELLKEVLAWLAPGAPVYGWEQVIPEVDFVGPASPTGHIWIPNDWSYNLAFTSLDYKNRQSANLAKVVNPKNIDYSLHKNFYSFYLSDGDNVQWMMNHFVDEYYMDPNAESTYMGFGIPVINIAMQSPDQFKEIMNMQKSNYTLIEALGGGYMYIDTFGKDAPEGRSESLKKAAAKVAASMRQHRIKVLGLHARDYTNEEACKEAYQAFIDANDQLEGILVISLTGYADGGGKTYWLTNKDGLHIPVITAHYALWNHEGNNMRNEGSPAYLARLMKERAQTNGQTFSVISLHAWSNFNDMGQNPSETSEMNPQNTGNLKGASAAKLVERHLGDDFKVVSVQELIWRIRMQYYPEETQQYINTLK